MSVPVRICSHPAQAGIEQAVAERKALRQRMLAHPPKVGVIALPACTLLLLPAVECSAPPIPLSPRLSPRHHPQMFRSRPKDVPALQMRLASTAAALAKAAPAHEISEDGDEAPPLSAHPSQVHPCPAGRLLSLFSTPAAHAGYSPPAPIHLQADSVTSSEESEALGAGWRLYNPPPVQEMQRRGTAAAPAPPALQAWQSEQRQASGLQRRSEPALAVLVETAPGELRVAPRSWSIAY